MWKTFAGRCIFRSPTGIRVVENPLFRWLQFDSPAIQTLINRYFPHKPELSYIKPFIAAAQLQPSNCCMLGLGGGGTAHALASALNFDKLVIVEKSAEVIEIASRFFMINQLKNISIIHEDANQFLQACPMQFQHLLVDLFNATTFPAQCNNVAFFAACKRVLKSEGILAINLANRHEQWPIFQLIRQQFHHATLVLPVLDSSNMIVFAQNSLSINPLLTLLKENNKIKKLSWDSKWGYLAES